jgi:hypothetical protein
MPLQLDCTAHYDNADAEGIRVRGADALEYTSHRAAKCDRLLPKWRLNSADQRCPEQHDFLRRHDHNVDRMITACYRGDRPGFQAAFIGVALLMRAFAAAQSNA